MSTSYISLTGFALSITLSIAVPCFAQDESGPPQIDVTPMSNGANLITPGTGQPVDETTQGNRTNLNFDTEPAPNSVINNTDAEPQ